MAFTFGFYDSVNGDRKYTTEQISSLFDGLITEGVFASIGDAFMTVPGEGMQVLVKSGKAWLRHTWNINDSVMLLDIEPADTTRGRYDAVVIEVNSRPESRTNAIKVIKGIASANPVKPNMENSGGIYQYPIAYISVPAGTELITTALIETVVGQSPCPFVTGIVESVDITNLFNQWNGEFDQWFKNLQEQLSGSVATNLQKQIDSLKSSFSSMNNRKVNYSDIEYSGTLNVNFSDKNRLDIPDPGFSYQQIAENLDTRLYYSTYSSGSSSYTNQVTLRVLDKNSGQFICDTTTVNVTGQYYSTPHLLWVRKWGYVFYWTGNSYNHYLSKMCIVTNNGQISNTFDLGYEYRNGSSYYNITTGFLFTTEPEQDGTRHLLFLQFGNTGTNGNKSVSGKAFELTADGNLSSISPTAVSNTSLGIVDSNTKAILGYTRYFGATILYVLDSNKTGTDQYSLSWNNNKVTMTYVGYIPDIKIGECIDVTWMTQGYDTTTFCVSEDRHTILRFDGLSPTVLANFGDDGNILPNCYSIDEYDCVLFSKANPDTDPYNKCYAYHLIYGYTEYLDSISGAAVEENAGELFNVTLLGSGCYVKLLSVKTNRTPGVFVLAGGPPNTYVDNVWFGPEIPPEYPVSRTYSYNSNNAIIVSPSLSLGVNRSVSVNNKIQLNLWDYFGSFVQTCHIRMV